jgi:TonB family protein
MVLAQAAISDPKLIPNPAPYLLLKKDSLPRGPIAGNAVAPTFPVELRAITQVTTIPIDVAIDRQGRVRRAKVVGIGNQEAQRAAMRAAIQWLFEPTVEGQSERTVRLSFTFRTVPAWAPPDELTTVFRNKYDVEVRAVVATPAPE